MACARKRQLGPVAVKTHSPIDQLLDLHRTLFNQDVNCLLAAKAITSLQGIVKVEANLIVLAQRRGDAALCVLRVGLERRALAGAARDRDLAGSRLRA